MEVRLEAVGSRPRADVLATLHDVAGWEQWLLGLQSLDVRVDADRVAEVALRFAAPRPVGLVLEVERLEDGLAYALIQGEVTEASGRIEVTGVEGGCRATWTASLRFPVSVPTSLRRELELRVLPGWLERLVRPPRPSAGA